MAFCRECGTQIADEDMFCPNCGTPREDVPGPEDSGEGIPYDSYESQGDQQSEGGRKGLRFNKSVIENKLGTVKSAVSRKEKPSWLKTAIICAVAVVVALILIITFAKGAGKAYTAPIKTTLNVMAKKQFNKSGMKTILQTLPSEVVEYMLDQSSCDSINEYVEDNEDVFEDLADEMEDYKITYEIKDSKQLKKKEIKSLEESYEDRYDIDIDIDDAYSTKVKLKADDGDGDKQKQTMSITTIKVKGKWYLDFSGFNNMLSF